MFLYFTAVVTGLDTMGTDIGVLYLFTRAPACRLVAAIALGAGIAFGRAAHTHLQQHRQLDRERLRGDLTVPAPAGRRRTPGAVATTKTAPWPTNRVSGRLRSRSHRPLPAEANPFHRAVVQHRQVNVVEASAGGGLAEAGIEDESFHMTSYLAG